MPERELQEVTAVLDLLVQPAFLVRQERIVYRNGAAERLVGAEVTEIRALLPKEALDAYRAFDGRSLLELPMEMDGRQYSALVRRRDAYDAFAAQLRPLYETLSFDVLATVAQAIRGNLSTLYDASAELFPMLEELERPEIQRQTARMNRSFYQLMRLAGNLADAGRYMAGEIRGFFEPTELCAFLERLFSRIQSLAAAAGVTAELHCPRQPLPAVVDRQKLERAVLNLFGNALRYARPGGRVTLRLEDFGHAAHITVADSGEGMEAAELAAAFDRYENRGQLPGDSRWGVGLGLPMVRFIANLHGGTVVVNSGPGCGTVVTMSVSKRLRPSPSEEVRSPVLNYDYAGSVDHDLLELSDVLPPEVFDTRNL